MKKSAVFTIITCSIAVVLLTGVLVIGLKSDGFGIISMAKEAAAELTGEKAPAGSNRYEYTWSTEDVDSISINWMNGAVEVKPIAGSEIKITETSDRALAEKDRLTLNQSSGELDIKWNNDLFTIELFQNWKKNLVVEIPEELAQQLESVSCKNTSGKLSLSGLTAQEMEATSVSGGVSVERTTAKTMDIFSTSGEIVLSQVNAEEMGAHNTSGSIAAQAVTAKDGDFTTVSGGVKVAGEITELTGSSVSASVEAELSNCPESIDFSSVSGSVTVTIPENAGFRAEYSSVSGSLSSDFPLVGGGGKSGEVIYGNGGADFQFASTSGSVDIKKSV